MCVLEIHLFVEDVHSSSYELQGCLTVIGEGWPPIGQLQINQFILKDLRFEGLTLMIADISICSTLQLTTS